MFGGERRWMSQRTILIWSAKLWRDSFSLLGFHFNWCIAYLLSAGGSFLRKHKFQQIVSYVPSLLLIPPQHWTRSSGVKATAARYQQWNERSRVLFGYLMWRANSLEKTLMLGKTEGRIKRWQRMRWLDGVTDSTTFKQTPGDGKGQGTLAAAVNGVKKSRTRLSDWTTARVIYKWQ